MPESAAYKRYTMANINQRLQIVQNVIFCLTLFFNFNLILFKKQETDPSIIESKIQCGQCEELLIQANNELSLARRFLAEKPWEPLISQPAEDQWKWPI